jgi:hypothetical protein
MAARMARTIGPVTATSANWKVMARAWRTTRAPILINLSSEEDKQVKSKYLIYLPSIHLED